MTVEDAQKKVALHPVKIFHHLVRVLVGFVEVVGVVAALREAGVAKRDAE